MQKKRKRQDPNPKGPSWQDLRGDTGSPTQHASPCGPGTTMAPPTRSRGNRTQGSSAACPRARGQQGGDLRLDSALWLPRPGRGSSSSIFGKGAAHTALRAPRNQHRGPGLVWEIIILQTGLGGSADEKRRSGAPPLRGTHWRRVPGCSGCRGRGVPTTTCRHPLSVFPPPARRLDPPP